MPVCSTSLWNSTSTNLAGSTGNRGSTATLLYNPTSSAFDIYGNLFVADTVNSRIQYFPRGEHFSTVSSLIHRCISCSGSTTGTTIAGITSSAGASYSQLNSPTAIFLDGSNPMFILDSSNCRILRWQIGEPMGFPVAGDHGCGSSLTQIDTSYAMFIDQQMNIYISEYANHRVTLWSPSNLTAGVLVRI